jgi:nitrous oxidase accessory protein NosD
MEKPDADFTEIQQAINSAEDGDTIEVYFGRYNEGTPSGAHEGIVINKSLFLRGIGNPVIDAFNKGSGMTLKKDRITIEGFSFVNAGSGSLPFSKDYYDIHLGYVAFNIHYGSSRNKIKNNIINGSLYLDKDSANNVIEYNNFTRSNINLYAASQNNITNNNFLNSTVKIEGYNTGYPVYYTFSSQGNIIEDNLFNQTARTSDYTVFIFQYAPDNIIIDNQIFSGSVRTDSDRAQIIDNNIIGKAFFPTSDYVGITIFNANDVLLDGKI